LMERKMAAQQALEGIKAQHHKDMADQAHMHSMAQGQVAHDNSLAAGKTQHEQEMAKLASSNALANRQFEGKAQI
jgi:hypothetical protein